MAARLAHGLAINPEHVCTKRVGARQHRAAALEAPPCDTHTALPLCLGPAVAMDAQMGGDDAQMGGDDDDEYEDLYVVLELPEVHSSFLSSGETYVHWLAH